MSVTAEARATIAAAQRRAGEIATSGGVRNEANDVVALVVLAVTLMAARVTSAGTGAQAYQEGICILLDTVTSAAILIGEEEGIL